MEDCGCKDKCLLKLPQTTREQVYENYRTLTTCNEKYLYLSGLIYKEDRKGKNLGNRKLFLFHVRVDGLNMCVCRKAFENIHGISSRDIEKVLQKLKKNVICLDPEEELFGRRATLKAQHVLSSRSRDRVIEHVESVLSQSEVKEHILKGEKLNVAMLYADYKSTLEKERRLVAISFDDQLGSDENNLGPKGYNPVSASTYRMLFGEVYPGLLEKLRKEGKIESSPISRPPQTSQPFKTPNVEKEVEANEGGKRQNTSDQSKRLSAKRMTFGRLDSSSTQEEQERQSSNLYVVADDSTDSALYLLPTSTKILNKTNLVSNVVETVYYL